MLGLVGSNHFRKLLVVALFSLFATSHALAHSKMKTSNPADGATVDAGLTEIELYFSKGIRLTLVKLKHDTASGKQDSVMAKVPKVLSEQAVVTVPPLEAGAYKVSWTGVGEDGHVMKGSFSFNVAAK